MRQERECKAGAGGRKMHDRDCEPRRYGGNRPANLLGGSVHASSWRGRSVPAQRDEARLSRGAREHIGQSADTLCRNDPLHAGQAEFSRQLRCPRKQGNFAGPNRQKTGSVKKSERLKMSPGNKGHQVGVRLRPQPARVSRVVLPVRSPGRAEDPERRKKQWPGGRKADRIVGRPSLVGGERKHTACTAGRVARIPREERES